MIAQAFETAQYVQNEKTGETGLVYRVTTSPYYREEIEGIERVQVQVEIPGAGGTFYGWDYWLLEDCKPLTAVEIPAGHTVKIVTRKHVLYGMVLSTNHKDVCVMLSDGTSGWASRRYVRAIYAPLALPNSALQSA